MKLKHPLWALAPLFLVIFIDSMGLGLLFPVLNTIVINPASNFLPASLGSNTRALLFGSILGIFMICWFFGAAILGDLSDKIGRKRSLLICLVGSFLGYLISAFAIPLQSIFLLLIGRVIAGFTAGSQPIAQAAIVDVSSEEHKPRNIGFMIMTISFGFVLGPILGGFLSDAHIYRHFTYATPLYFAALISLVNALLLFLFFEETFEIKGKIKIKLHQALHVFASAFQNEKIRTLSLSLLIMIFGWSNFYTFIPIYLWERFKFTPTNTALFLALGALGFSISCALLVDFLAKRFPLRKIVITTFFLTALEVFVIAVSHNLWIVGIANFLTGISLGIGYSTIITMFSNQVSSQEQGWVMGVTGSIMALCFGLTSFFTGLITDLGADISLYISALGLLISSLILFFMKTNGKVQ